MEELLNRVIHLAVGAMVTAKEGIKERGAIVEREIEVLIQKGAIAEDENSILIKDYADGAIQYLRKLNQNIEKAANSTKPIINDALAYLERIRGEHKNSSLQN